MRPTKSTRGEVMTALVLAAVTLGCAFVYMLGGGRAWIFGALWSVVMLIAVVAGIAER